MVNRYATPYYLRPLHLTHNYHFQSSETEFPAVFFEVRLRDGKGNLVKTLRFPDKDANFWVRHRQSLLAQGLGDDRPVAPPRGESIPAPGKKMREVTIWQSEPGDKELKLQAVPENLLPRDRPAFQPSPWSLLLARSYARHLCREYGAASAEVIRHSRDAVVPAVLFQREFPPGTFEELICNFGEYHLEE
jgi:hypothetical protein